MWCCFDPARDDIAPGGVIVAVDLVFALSDGGLTMCVGNLPDTFDAFQIVKAQETQVRAAEQQFREIDAANRVKRHCRVRVKRVENTTPDRANTTVVSRPTYNSGNSNSSSILGPIGGFILGSLLFGGDDS